MMDQGKHSKRRFLRTRIKVILVLCILLIITAHIMGYKIYGKRPIIYNQPLQSPQNLQSINESGEVVLDNGKIYKIYGITTIVANPLESSKLRRVRTENVEIEKPDSAVSRVWCKEIIIYWGDDVIYWHSWLTRNRRLFPKRRPAFRKRDLAEIFVQEGLAVPEVELFEQDFEYAKTLISSIRDISKLNIEQNEDEVILLGKYLCDNNPDLFNQGAWLLAHSGDREIFEPVRTKLNELLSLYDIEVKTKGSYYSNPRYTGDMSREMLELISILIRISPEESKTVLREIVETPREAYLRVRFALILNGIGDLYGLDLLMEEVNSLKPRRGTRTALASELEDMLNNTYERFFSSESDKEMYEWYQKNRLNIRWDQEKHRIILTNEE
ncbi:MAG: hypothetical protein JW715_13825 [Sedimentisphaerales bacterium]|nr:hypothetical protein [Sedimentisphaerales bacterium]